jgi:hypothetical protein
MKALTLVFTLLFPALVHGQTAMSCLMHEQHESSAHHAADVDARGDKGMGFSHDKSTHHFQLLSSGGIIEVNANDKTDTTTLDEIRGHLSHVAQMFSAGDFQIPMLIHDTVPPGVPVMKSKRTAIAYAFESTPTGARVRITTSDPDALNAVHQFLTFQIDDHRTGDSDTVKPLPKSLHYSE